MITADQAIATAQQWEAEKAAGPSALVGRALLAHINSLASPQVTDEQIVVPRDRIEKLLEYSDKEYVPNALFAEFRALLSAPPAAETPTFSKAAAVVHQQHKGDTDLAIKTLQAAPREEAKPVAADDILRLADNYAHDMLRGYGDVARQTLADALQAKQFQSRVLPWMLKCFGETISNDLTERNHRFLEEALELVQSTGCTQSEAHQLVDYVYGRPVGEPSQEVGGVMVTLAALCLAAKLNMHAAGETELARIWTKVDVIRAKQAAKPKHSPLPQHIAAAPQEQAPAEKGGA